MAYLSHLLQMRGLKQEGGALKPSGLGVASFTDAWIETLPSIILLKPLKVASFTDAWIETFQSFIQTYQNWSHLLQMRGLKPVEIAEMNQRRGSHLLQMRGLKRNV